MEDSTTQMPLQVKNAKQAQSGEDCYKYNEF